VSDAALATSLAQGTIPEKLGREAIDAVGGAGSFLGAVLSTPLAAGIKAIAGTKTPVTFSPSAKLRQLEELKARMEAEGIGGLLPSAQILDIATDLPGVKALNLVGGKALLPAGRAMANLEAGGLRARAIPGIKQGLEFIKPGASLPNYIRDDFYRILRSSEGKADWRAFVREKRFSKALRLPAEAQDDIAKAIERRTIGNLSPEAQGTANELVREFRWQVAARIRAHMKRHELESPYEFVPRVATRKERVRLGAKPYGTAVEVPGGLSTGRMEKRTDIGRASTTEEMSASAAALGHRAFEPVVKGTMLRGAQNDLRVMHADIVSGLVRRFGRPLGRGERSVADLRGVPTGFTGRFKGRLERTALPKELHEVVDRLNHTFQPEEWGKVQQSLDFVNNQFRKWALFSPGFHARNEFNNILQSAIFGNVSPSAWKEGIGQTSRIYLAKKLGDLSPEDLRDAREAIQLGVIGRGQASQETARGMTSSKWSPFTWSRTAGSYLEDSARLSHFKYLRNKGLVANEAAEKVDRIFFNYSPRFQSQGLKGLRRNFMPFINWQINAPQLFALGVIERPGSIGLLGGARARINEAAGYPPEALSSLGPDVVEQGGIVEGPGKQPGTVRVAYPQAYGPYGDVNEIVNSLRAGGPGIARLLGTRSFPQFGLGASEAFQRNLFLRKPHEYSPGRPAMTTAPAMLKLLAANENGQRFLEEHGFRLREDGSVEGPVRSVTWLTSFPQFRLANIVADLLKPDPNSEFRVKSFLAGIREVERDPKFRDKRKR